MKRRDFIAGAGAVAAWPAVAPGQQTRGTKRVAFILGFSRADQEAVARFNALRDGLTALGWVEGRNLAVEERWAADDIELLRRHVDEVVALNPDAVVCGHTVAAQRLRQASRAIPTVFVGIADPVGSGVVTSLAKPGGNITGFTAFEYAISGKWLSLLKEFAPQTERVALIFNVRSAPWAETFWQQFESSAPSYRIKPVRMDVRGAEELQRAIEDFAREPNGGLLGVPATAITLHRKLVMALAEKHRLPAVYPYRYFPAEGGLASYGIDVRDMWRRAASYVDRVLKGEKPANLPVQAPTKFEFVINQKTARAIGLNLPPTLIARADEVIE